MRRTNPAPGAATARFICWYPFLRFFLDLFRDDPTHRLALGTGQTLNIAMMMLGAVLLYRYGARHAGLQHSWLHPDIDTRAPQRTQ